MLSAVDVLGSSVPPMFVFPRVHFNDHMLKGAPPGSIVAHPSGWMTAENFAVCMKHFVKFTHVKPDNPVLLLIDNHDSPMSVDVINCAKSNGIYPITFPPHCCHKIQPLERTVYGPFKHYFNTSANGYMNSNPDETIIHDICEYPIYIQTVSEKKNMLHHLSQTVNKLRNHKWVKVTQVLGHHLVPIQQQQLLIM
ncbi:hypothetical protein SNE40_012094 [Patella caerulea]|uniref:DDE-1 domain-containing protein n=1 Tax=Patella caerulea TaxID=87958 RepID=A0AAN8JQU9_PATCE